MRRVSYLIGTGFLAVSAVWGGEIATLSNGFQIRAERHELQGNRVRLYAGDGGVTELPSQSVVNFEQETAVPKPTPAPVPVETSSAPIAASPLDLTREAARQQGIPAPFIESVMAAESAYRTNAVSPKGAIGLMQLMPSTARSLGVDPHDPRQNVAAGARYLRELLTKYADHDDQVLRALAAYNAGPGAVDKYHGVPPYPETSAYIRRVLKTYARLQQ
jgi:soluble lytic murein transglycosylase-like protein